MIRYEIALSIDLILSCIENDSLVILLLSMMIRVMQR